MGLDVYLYRYNNFEKTKIYEEKYSAESEKIWDYGDRKYEDLTEGEKEEARKKCKEYAQMLGLDEDGEDSINKTNIEIPSKKYPEHYFQIGYFRSSYNESGINRILSNSIGITLYDLFPHNDEDYDFQPNWSQSLLLVKKAHDQFSNFLKKNGHTSVFTINDYQLPKQKIDAQEAMKIFCEEFHKGERSFGSFSNHHGDFFLDKPLLVRALIPAGGDSTGVHVIYDGEDLSFYIQALEIIMETCEYVLSQPDPEKYYLHWSS